MKYHSDRLGGSKPRPQPVASSPRREPRRSAAHDVDHDFFFQSEARVDAFEQARCSTEPRT